MSSIDSNTNEKVEVESDLLRIIRGSWIEQENGKENEPAQRSNQTKKMRNWTREGVAISYEYKETDIVNAREQNQVTWYLGS